MDFTSKRDRQVHVHLGEEKAYGIRDFKLIFSMDLT